MSLKYEKFENVKQPYIFRKTIAAGATGFEEIELTGNGAIEKLIITFAAGENGTLQLRPYVILNAGIPQELLNYSSDNYINGDDARFEIDCYQEIENHAKLRVQYNNTGTGESRLSVDVIVHYNDYITERNIIG